MPIEAYQVGVSLIADESRVVGPLRQMIEAMQRVQAATREAQSGLDGFRGTLRAAARDAAGLASSMERVAKASRAAASAGSPGGGASATAARAEAAAGRAERVAAATSAAVPPALLTYSSQARAVSTPERLRLAAPPERLMLSGPRAPLALAGPGAPLMLAGPSSGGALVATGLGYSQGNQPLGPFGGNAGRPYMPGAGGFANPYAGLGGGPTINLGGPAAPQPFPYIPPMPGGYSPVPPSPPMPPMPGGGGSSPLNRSSRAHFAMQGGIEAYEGFELLKSIFEATEKPDDEIEKLRAARFTSAQIEQAKAAALAIQRKTPGMGYASGLDLINQTASFTGDVAEALALSPALARNAQVLSQYGKGDAIAQVEKGIQAGELTGLTGPDGKMNIPKLTEFITRLTGTVVAGGGTLNIGKYLTGVRQFGVGADSATMDFTTAVLPAYMKIMGEARAGTALSSFQQSLGSTAPKTQNKSITAEQKRLGIRDAKGNLVDGELLRTDANAYIGLDLLPKVANDLTRRHLEVTPAAIQGELTKLLPRQTMIRLAAAGIFDAAVITKEANRNREQQAAQANAEKAGKAGPLDTLLAQSPGNQVKATVEAFHTFEAALGDPAMRSATQTLNGITDGLLKMAGWAREHPDITEAALKGVAGGLAVLGGAAAIAALTMIGGTTGLLAGIGAAAAAAATGMEKLDAVLHKFLPGLMGPQVPAGTAYDPARDGPVYDPSKHGLMSRLYNDPGGTILGRDKDGGLQNPLHKSSYAAPANNNRPIITHVVFKADMREIARGTIVHMDRAASRDPSGITGFDPRQTMTPPGQINA
jgi:hypothetical protein